MQKMSMQFHATVNELHSVIIGMLDKYRMKFKFYDVICIAATIVLLLSVTSCQTESSEKETEMVLRINDQVIQVEWENNESVEALKDLVRSGTITLEMTMYGGFEQYGSLGVTLPSNDEQLTTSPGDIVLYTSDKICIYYGVNTWAFTRLGKIQNMSEEDLTSLLGSSDVTVTISID